MFLPSDHPCLIAVHKDGLGLRQVPPTAISPLQLWSCRVVQVTNHKKIMSFSRWVIHAPYPMYRVRGHVSSIRTLQHLFFLCTCGKLWCAPRCVVLGVMMTDDVIYRGISPVRNLNNQKHSWGRYHQLSCMTNNPTSHMEKEPMMHMIHRETY